MNDSPSCSDDNRIVCENVDSFLKKLISTHTLAKQAWR